MVSGAISETQRLTMKFFLLPQHFFVLADVTVADGVKARSIGSYLQVRFPVTVQNVETPE
jgi:hypothetical protein